MPSIDPRRIALIGFGEVGGLFAQGLIASGRHDVSAYDILMDGGPAFREKARSLGVEPCASASDAARGAQIIISAVTAAAARGVAEAAGEYMRRGQIFLDVNSVSPETKRANAAAVERSGAAYVEAAVMAAVAPYGLKVPILLGGTHAETLKAMLGPAGMTLDVAAVEIGRASAIKMCRSIMIKGIEALTVECLLTARRYGIEDDIVASLDKSHPQMDWDRQAGYSIGRVVQHGRRRAAEMREAAETVAEAGLEPLMAAATAARQDWVADRVADRPALKSAAEADWRKTLDALSASVREDAET
jgi:3-hydroxyisobutyrate dehydrogenase-like beta-hydroxyacid dehydrogenase